MPKILEPIVFDPAKFEKELKAFGSLLSSKTDLAESVDIQPFFKNNKQLSAYIGSFSLKIWPATELAFEYPFFGDFTADLLLGNKKAGEFCVVEFEDGGQNSIFKKQGTRGNAEWTSRFDHGFSQMVDWFYNLHDFKGTDGFARTFGYGHITFVGLLIIGRSTDLDKTQRNRLRWRSERVLIDSHPVSCITFDDLHQLLSNRFVFYGADSKLENKKKKK